MRVRQSALERLRVKCKQKEPASTGSFGTNYMHFGIDFSTRENRRQATGLTLVEQNAKAIDSKLFLCWLRSRGYAIVNP